MATISTENNKPIVEALKNVFELFGIEKDKEDIGILHQNSLDDNIVSLLDKYEESREDKKKFTVVCFDFTKDKEPDKWKRDTFRFWCGFFERLGVGYPGNNIIQFVKQIESSQVSIKSKRHFEFLQSIRKYKNKKTPTSYPKIVRKINNHDYTLSTVLHGGKLKKTNDPKLSYLITALRESILWSFKATQEFNILIIDDRAYKYKPTEEKSIVANLKKSEPNDKIIIDIIKLIKVYKDVPINWYLLSGNGDDAFRNAITELLEEKPSVNKYFARISLENNEKVKVEKVIKFNKFTEFNYLLVDLYLADSQKMEGLELISKLKHKIEEKTRRDVLTFEKPKKGKNCLIPEILAYTISDDVETIQMAQRMGAAGYVHKENPEVLALSIVRAGAPLELKDATRLDYFTTNNFPCIASLPRQIIKDLFNSKISVPNADGQVEKADDLVWIRSIPKADNHVHFGTAIPLEWCYILSLISLYHWNNYWENQCKEADGKYEKYNAKIKTITKSIQKIIANTLNPSEDNEYSIKTVGFRRRFIHFFSKEYKTAEVTFPKDIINYLVKISDNLLNDNQIACLINVLLGSIILKKERWKELYRKAYVRVWCLQKELKKKENCNIIIYNLKLFRDCRYQIENMQLPSSYKFISDEFIKKFVSNDYGEINFDPLSEMLSTGKADNPYGLERYLASSCLVGSSLLQFADTVLLASMSIPEWAAAKKVKKNNETEKSAKGKHNEKVADNVIHLELRTTPQGLLNPYDSKKSNSTLASKLICVGLEYGIKKLLKTPSAVTANLLISIKRDRKREDIIPCINTAVDLRDEYFKYIKDNNISEAEGFMIPHVSGLDVAGIERNNLPAELQPFYKEAFERCLLSTIHAGETESAQSVKDAIFMLNASRIGHGLSIKHDEELKRLIAERRICVELCPKSNQFTNGIRVFREETKDIKDKSVNQDEYVYNDDDFRGKMLLSINTDNPTISHKASSRDSFAYPISEEFIWLSGMINNEKQIPLSRLEVLSLIYNGFVSMFAPEQAKKAIMSFADQEVLSLLAEEYLDICKD